MENANILTLHVNKDGVGTVVIDLPGERLNILKRQAMEELVNYAIDRKY